MKELTNCYIIDKLENIGRYAGLSANFKTACDFLAKGAFDTLTAGKNAIDGEEVFVNNVAASYVARAERKVEFHRAYFDIHVPLAEDETIGLANFDALAKSTFDEASDCGLVEQPVEYFTVKKGEFAICWPITCAHAPAITCEAPKTAAKLIVKIKA